jgi:hypothetical protein
MSALVDDDVLRTFVAYAESPGELAADLRRRTDGVDRVALHSGTAAAPESWSDIVRALRT